MRLTSWDNVIQLFTAVFYKISYLAGVFVPGKLFRPCLPYPRAYPRVELLKGASLE